MKHHRVSFEEQKRKAIYIVKCLVKNKRGQCARHIITPDHYHRHRHHHCPSTIVSAAALLFAIVLFSLEVEASLDVSSTK